MKLNIAELGPRIVIIGGSCSGKSTLATRLGTELNLPVCHLDQIKWMPGQIAAERPDDAFQADLAKWVAAEQWIIEGCYASALPVLLPRATAVIHLTTNRVIALWRYLQRLYGGRQISITEGDFPSFKWAMVRWIMWDYPRRKQPKITAALRGHAKVVELR